MTEQREMDISPKHESTSAREIGMLATMLVFVAISFAIVLNHIGNQ